MYGSYERTHSVFQNSEMMAKGEPSAEEIALLEPFRDRVLPEVFGPAWVPPVSDGSGQDRKLLRSAGDLLNAAGWTVKDGKRVNAKGEQLSVEFLLTERSFEPHHTTFIKNLRVLGIDANIRARRSRRRPRRGSRTSISTSRSRASSIRKFPAAPCATISRASSPRPRGRTTSPGIADPVIDALVEKAIAAQSQAQLNTACRALDRVLRSGRYWIPHWSKASYWIAYWDQFGYPQGQAALRARRAGDVVVRGQQGGQD